MKDIAQKIERDLRKDKKIVSLIESKATQISICTKSILSIHFLLKKECFYIKSLTDIIRETLTIVKSKNHREIKIVEITILHNSRINENNKRILRFSANVNTICDCDDFTPEMLRIIKPLYDLNDSEPMHCGWYFLKRFSDESDSSWLAFQSHPHYRAGDNIPDFIE